MPFQVAIAQFEGATSLRVPPLAAGLLASTLRRSDGLPDVAVRVHAARREPDAAAAALAGSNVAAISLYTWNTRYALEVARRARLRNPALRVVAGGPSVPRREEARARFLAQHPFVDALVLGEGERAFVEVVRALRDGGDLGAIAGVVARGPDGALLAGPPRPRLEGDGFDGVGSPYLDGTFDELVASGEIPPFSAAVLETNRGCPFACTFCDWGQAIHSRVHELPRGRVDEELAWLARRGVPYLYLVDANFGIRRRDEEIVRRIGELARRHAAPRFVYFHLTKNATDKNLRTVEILREHGVGTQVALSMQDFDHDVLLAIRRDNIRPEAALALRERCHAQGLPTHNELLLGLPAQTADSFRRSLVQAITPFPGDSFFLYLTRLLENAEMAEPAYRARYGIETRLLPQRPADPSERAHVEEQEEVVVATAALPAAAFRRAFAFGYLLSALWNQRLLSTTIHVLRFALGADLAAWIDALLASERPRLRAVRAELLRFADSIAAGRDATLPVAGRGERRREPSDAACALVLDDPAAFYDEVAEETAAFAGANARAVRDAVAWDALHVEPPAGARRFAFDWPRYESEMGARPQPLSHAIEVRAVAASGRLDLDAFLALGWSKQPRVHVVRLPDPPPVSATPPGPRPFTPAPADPEERRRRAHADGFLYLPRLLPPERLAPLRAVIDRALVARGWLVDGRTDPSLRLGRWDDTRWLGFLQEVLPSHAYRELGAAPEILAALRQIMGSSPRLHVGDVCRLVSPQAPDLTTPPHQDAAYLQDADDVWTAWLPVGACPLELGPLSLLPGSHRQGLRPHANVDRNGPVIGIDLPADLAWHSADLEAGDVLLFSALTVHRALPNVTADRLRVSVDYRYRPTGR